MSSDRTHVPREFREVLAGIASARVRGDVTLTEAPAPHRIAPYAVALNAEITRDGDVAGTGRLVVLHDPAGQEAWEGTLRVVALVKAEVEPEIRNDEVWAEVAWSWIRDALERVPIRALGCTVTRTLNESFGNLSDRGRSVVVEMRASWTPVTTEIHPHLEAWVDLLGSCAGVPPVPDGVTILRGKAS